MVEKIVLQYLNSRLDVPSYMERPDKPPDEYIVIEKTGGGTNNHIKRAMFAIQSYAQSLLRAAELNEEVKTAMEDIIVLDDISRCGLNSDYNFTDTKTREYRYQAVFDLVYF